MKNVLMNVKTSFKKVMKEPKKYLTIIRPFIVSTIILAPKIVLAADPTAQVISVVTGLTNAALVIAPSIGGLAFLWHGIGYQLAGDPHQMAEKRESMKKVVINTVICMIAVGLIQWVASLAK